MPEVCGDVRRCVVSILTDFGLSDPYVGVMKGVILGINPLAVPVDLSHEVPPQSIRIGAFMLEASWRYFPEGTVHLAVVDPGVGTDRAPIVVSAGNHLFVGPDNGLFTPVFETFPDARAWRLEASVYRLPRPSMTFHGRDVFAPAAAWLSRGVPPGQFGPVWPSPLRLEALQPVVQEGRIDGEVSHVDRFGNLVTNIPGELVRGARWEVQVSGERVSVHRTYGDVLEGAPLGLIGSFDRVEVSVRGGSAAERFQVGVGARVSLVRLDDLEKVREAH